MRKMDELVEILRKTPIGNSTFDDHFFLCTIKSMAEYMMSQGVCVIKGDADEEKRDTM